MRRPFTPSRRALATATACLAGLGAGGCGGSLAGAPGARQPDRPLSAADVERVANQTTMPAAARVVLAFWRAAQTGRYGAAWHTLSPQLQRQIPLGALAARLARQRSVFSRFPAIRRVTATTSGWQVMLAPARGGVLRTDAPQLTFSVIPAGGRYLISGSPVP